MLHLFFHTKKYITQKNFNVKTEKILEWFNIQEQEKLKYDKHTNNQKPLKPEEFDIVNNIKIKFFHGKTSYTFLNIRS